jgi:acetyltransferase-like isoleucine patch superfamily enzyme
MTAQPSRLPLQRHLAGLGIVMPQLLQASRLHRDISIEHPCVVTKTVTWDLPLSIGAFSMVYALGHVQSASIGRYCSVAPYAVIGANEHALEWLSTSSLLENPRLFNWNKINNLAALDSVTGIPFKDSVKPISIGNDVWIGLGAFIRGGVTIGDGAVIGSMANVIHDVPPYAIVIGNPARVLRYRFSDAIIKACLDFKWWRFAPDVIINSGPTSVEQALDRLAKLEHAGTIKPYVCTPVTTSSLKQLADFQV